MKNQSSPSQLFVDSRKAIICGYGRWFQCCLMVLLHCGASAWALIAAPATASSGETVEVGDDIEFDAIIDARLRFELVDQGAFSTNAEGITLRTRAGARVQKAGFSVLAEAEGTVALRQRFNDTIAENGIEPFPSVADPENIELNRLHFGYESKQIGLTIGRQRIIHDDARFLGNVGWRQNEQTFDAVRAVFTEGPLSIDGSFAISQRTIFGSKSDNPEFKGNFTLLHAALDLSAIELTGFSYLIDYDDRIDFSSQTYGLSAELSVPIGSAQIGGRLSYAVQSDFGQNPKSYKADYVQREVSVSLGGFSAQLGIEQLGSDGGNSAFQTPLATLHAFNGYADLFLNTPADGLRDSYIGLGQTLKFSAIPNLKFGMTFHNFRSDHSSQSYGNEIDTTLAFAIGDVAVVAKYARYNSEGFGVDAQRFWLQTSINL